MRPIKFRGKLVDDNDKWAYGDVTFLRAKGISELLAAVIERYIVIPETVGQYTGVNDSKRTAEYPEGQPIYEGDIIKADLPQKCYDGVRNLRLACGKVYFDKGSFKVTDRVADVRLDDFANDVILEVLGNVHDDPDLLVRWS